jgi:hypothetical protein
MSTHDTNRYGNCVTIDCPVCFASKPAPTTRYVSELTKAAAAAAAEPVPVVRANEKHLGWKCPVCDAVWAPFVRKCEGCK